MGLGVEKTTWQTTTAVEKLDAWIQVDEHIDRQSNFWLVL